MFGYNVWLFLVELPKRFDFKFEPPTPLANYALTLRIHALSLEGFQLHAESFHLQLGPSQGADMGRSKHTTFKSIPGMFKHEFGIPLGCLNLGYLNSC